MSPTAGRIRRRPPRPSIVVPPERDVTTGRYSRGLGHEDKEQQQAARRAGRSARPRGWMVAAAAAGVAALGVAAIALSSGDDGGTAIATTTVTVAATVAAPSTTLVPTTVAPPVTTPPPPSSTSTSTIPAPLPPATPADALAGRYRVTAIVTGDSLVPDRAGSSVPFEPLVLVVSCESGVCTVTDRIWGVATLVDDSLSFAFASEVPCIDATRPLDSVIMLAVTEKDALGFVEKLEGTATFTWGAAASRCPGFIEDFSLVAVRA